jgi:hypothetical protein
MSKSYTAHNQAELDAIIAQIVEEAGLDVTGTAKLVVDGDVVHQTQV